MRPCTTTTPHMTGTTARSLVGARRRRGAVMIFVLGVLTLVALVGLLLIAKTHGEFKRVTEDSNATSLNAAADGVLRQIGDILRADIIPDPVLSQGDSSRPLGDNAPRGSNVNQLGLRENNEGFDKAGIDDRWLAELLPRYVGDVSVSDGMAIVIEPDVLVWPHVSYPGIDILLPRPSNPFVWGDNARTPGSGLVQYGAYDLLLNVPILQTPSAMAPSNPMIPGSTTNVSIRQSRAYWQSVAHQTALANAIAAAPGLLDPGVMPQFPYFDTNGDGIPDLYDADGDGVPDSPLSFVIHLDTADPNKPRTLWAAIRVVDHAAMLNVNAASAQLLPDGATLTFNENDAWRQRRGRSATEFLLDAVAHRDDWVEFDRTAGAVGRRNNSTTPDPLLYEVDIVKRTLLGGRPQTLRQYFPFDLTDEASLRHRNLLVPFDRVNDNLAAAGDYRNIDRALRNTLLWNRHVIDNPNSLSWSYDDAQTPRWNRLNFNYQPAGSTTTYEGYTDAGGVGARKLLDEDESWFVRRPLLTTVNRAVHMPPNIVTASIPAAVVTPDPTDTPLDVRMRQLWSIGMNWPTLVRTDSALASDTSIIPTGGGTLFNRFIVDPADPAVRFPAEWARVNPVDLNMHDPVNPAGARADFVRFAAAAMYMALDGVGTWQGVQLTPPVREYLAWQFAANLADFRDSDSDPTIVAWPTQPGHYIFGVEKQPFFTEAFAHLIAGDNGTPTGPGGQNQPPGGPDQWFYAFELYVPPGWSLPTQNLYFRRPDSPTTLLPLSTFLQVTNSLPAQTLDGGPVDINAVSDADHGNYYIFCGLRDAAPPSVLNNPSFQARAYVNDALSISNNGGGSLELLWSPTGDPADPLNHVLDIIDPRHTGGHLAGNSTSGHGRWAVRPPTLPPGAQRSFSLRRSTKGWRFTTAWQVYAEGPLAGGTGGVAFNESLGRPNDVLNELNDFIPESVWPALTNTFTANGEPHFRMSDGVSFAPGFASDMPFEAFDSVGELGRMFMIGALIESGPPALPAAFGLPVGNVAPTAMLADILRKPATTDLPANTEERVAAGRPDFFGARRVGSPAAPWTWRLFDYFTTTSHLFDGVDNDGDGLADLFDPTEAADVRFMRAGLPNLNTAPATVLRAGPHMSLLPTSPELVVFDPSGLQDPAGSFNAAANGFFHDFASAIISLRDDRPVPLRLRQGANGAPATVAVAQRKTALGGSTTVTERGAFASVAELAEINERRMHDSLSGRDNLFQIDRLSSRSALPLSYHTIQTNGADIEHSLGIPGTGSPFSPDFRFRRDSENADYVPIRVAPGFTGNPNQVQGSPLDAAGIRGRDAYFARMTNLYSVRSDVFTVYIALIDEDGNYVHRSQVTVDRSVCFDEILPGELRDRPIQPRILVRRDGSYTDDTK